MVLRRRRQSLALRYVPLVGMGCLRLHHDNNMLFCAWSVAHYVGDSIFPLKVCIAGYFGALPPVDFPTVCLVRAMLLLLLLCVVLLALARDGHFTMLCPTPPPMRPPLTNAVGGTTATEKFCLLRTRTALLLHLHSLPLIDVSLLRCGKTTRQSPWTRQLAQKLEVDYMD